MHQQFTPEQQEEIIRKLREQHEAQQRGQAQQQEAHMEFQRKVHQARLNHQLVQKAIDEAPKVKYVIIVALDLLGGFAKDGKIPWHYAADLKWFKQRTENHVCIMGRNTYQDINERVKNPESVLPKRKCFVLSTTLSALQNATVVKSFSEVELKLNDEDFDKTRFIIGGDRVFKEGIALASELYVTLINKDYQCDQLFNTSYITQHFEKERMYKSKKEPDLRFVHFVRKKNEQQTTNPTDAESVPGSSI